LKEKRGSVKGGKENFIAQFLPPKNRADDDREFMQLWKNHPVRINKKQAFKYWTKLSDLNKMIAINNHKNYLNYLKTTGYNCMYLQKYLNPTNELFASDWVKSAKSFSGKQLNKIRHSKHQEKGGLR
jgi:predicted house-cleaning noncanonical NTP pyrophosphatase (MazG superfamily)